MGKKQIRESIAFEEGQLAMLKTVYRNARARSKEVEYRIKELKDSLKPKTKEEK